MQVVQAIEHGMYTHSLLDSFLGALLRVPCSVSTRAVVDDLRLLVEKRALGKKPVVLKVNELHMRGGYL